MIKYLCIDTNIFIQCCLLEIKEGDDFQAIDALLKSLNEGSLKLLLPEVVDLEFYRKLEEKTEKIQKQINKYKEEINKDNELDEKVRKDIIESLCEIIEVRLTNKEKVKEKVKEIFSHRNTIKSGLEITPESLVESYKHFLIREKPCKKDTKYLIEADCLIIQILKTFFKDKSDYEFYFCSLNSSDFVEENISDKVKNENPLMHKDISKHFNHIEYRANVLTLLKEKFNAEISSALIGKFDEATEINELISKNEKLENNTTANSLGVESEIVGESISSDK